MKDFNLYYDLCATPVALLTDQGVIEESNAGFKLLFGDLNGKSFSSLQIQSALFQKEIVWKDLASAKENNNHLTIRTGVQADRIYKLSYKWITGQEKMLLQLWDITHQYFLEEKFATKQALIKTVIDGFPEGVCAYDEQGVIRVWNQKCEQLTGYSEEEIVGNPEGFQKLFVHKSEMLEAFAKWNTRDNDVIRNWDMEITRKDGLRRVLRLTVRYRQNPILEGLHQWVIASDITDYIRTREELKKSEERYRIISKATNDAIWDWDLVKNELWWNDGISELFGYDVAEVENTIDWWVDRLHPDYREPVYKRLEEYARHGIEYWSDEYLFRKKNGDYAYVYDRGYTMKDAEGKPYRMIGGMKDLSSQKEYEQLALAKDARLQEIMEYNSSKVVTPVQHVTHLALTLALMTHENMKVKDHVDRLLLAARDAEKAVRSMNERYKQS
jgi:PAS domain S-box-containing protein